MAMFMNNCRKCILVSAQLHRSSSIASSILVRHSSYESKKFPDYHVIYNCESINTVSVINRLKRNTTVIALIAASTSYALEAIDLLPLHASGSVIVSGLSISLFFHCLGYFANNVIGLIYAKKNTDDVMISYVNYWGKRVDIQTKGDDIQCFETENFLTKIIAPFFNKMVVSPKLSLKLYTNGTIVDEKKFYKLYGIQF